MRKVLALSVALGLLPVLALAQNEPTDAKVGASCFDYYKFQSVELDLHGEKQIYKAGEGAKFTGSLINKNSYPLVGGSLVLRISKLDPRSQVGNDIIDEWVAKTDINLRAGEKQFVSLPYQLPSGLPTGTYVLTSYFLTQNKFNISGLSFTDDIYGGYATFTVEGQSEKSIRFDRNGVKVNGEPYKIFGSISKVFPEDLASALIGVPLKNETPENLAVSLTYTHYFWDAYGKDQLIKSWNETISLPRGTSKNLSFNIDTSQYPVHFVKIKAEAGDKKGEVHIKLVKRGFRPKLNYVGLTKFPLVGGEAATVFACFHNSTWGENDGKLDLELKSFSGRILAAASYEGRITQLMRVLAKEIKGRNLDKFTLSAKLYDDKNNLVDEVEIPYDCSKFSESICLKSRINFYTLLAGIVIIIIALYFLRKHFSNKGQQQI